MMKEVMKKNYCIIDNCDIPVPNKGYTCRSHFEYKSKKKNKNYKRHKINK